jgi:uncharacterized membrane protein
MKRFFSILVMVCVFMFTACEPVTQPEPPQTQEESTIQAPPPTGQENTAEPSISTPEERKI